MYDIVYIGKKSDVEFLRLQSRFPLIKTAANLNEAKRRVFTKFFWVVWNDIIVEDTFDFSYVVPAWDSDYVHVFKNDDSFNGICLIPKNRELSNREVEFNFFVNKKEIDIVASKTRKFDIFYVSNYEDYLSALQSAHTEMFWIVWDNIAVSDNFNFDYHIPRHNRYHRGMIHVFKNGEYFDGICLVPNDKQISKREIDFRFFVNKIEVDILASTPKLFDIVFISYYEKLAEENYQKLLSKVGKTHNVYRVDGVKGIHNAHIEAAKLVTTSMFWVVDADAIIEPTFKFEINQTPYWQAKVDLERTVHVWRSRNPINDLEYGYGGVKLLPKNLTLNMDTSKPDMTTSISSSFKLIPVVSNISAFNIDPFATWRSAFRECVKLSSKVIDGQVDTETEDRLNVWCSVGKDKLYGEYAIAGALSGREYGEKNAGNIPALLLINDFDWLKKQFDRANLP